jgi:HEAT repeat protein
MFAVLGLCWFAGAVAVPFWKTRETLAWVDQALTGVYEGERPSCMWGERDALWCVENMGGREALLFNLRVYLSAPKCVAPHRYCAAYFVSYAGRESQPLAEELMADPDPRVRRHALRGFCVQRAGEGDAAALDWALHALKDDDAAVYREAGELLAPLAFHFPQTVNRLVPLLDCGRRQEAVLAAWTLGQIAERLSWPSDSESLTAEVKEALSAAVPGLERLLNSEDHETRCVAAISLWRITGDGRKPLEALLASLSHKEADARCISAMNLVKMRRDAAAAVPALDQARQDPDPRVRECASDAFYVCTPLVVWLSHQELSVLIKELKDPKWDVRATAAIVLGSSRICSEDVRSALAAASRDRNWHVRECAAYALKEIGGGQSPSDVRPESPE